MSKLFLKPPNVLVFNVRTYIKKYKWYGEGIKYPGFTYYPRRPDFQEPEYEPTKLFKVQRIKPVKGHPHWEKKILQMLKLDGKGSDVAIVKNIPENNALLWKIKHLIKIIPITFPNGFPNEEDVNCTFLKDTGEFLVNKQMQPPTEVLEATREFENDAKKMDPSTLTRNSRLKWLNAWSTDL